jgi:iron complex outermembrane recepter protein
LNDPESQQVFWVDLPDFASSVDNIQVQRGIGFSTNGAGAFGATVNVKTNSISDRPYGQIDGSFGSFNTRKITAKFGSGLIKNRFSFDGRLSSIQSDGYVDRAASELKSYYLAAAFVSNKTLVKLLTFSGLEETYQAWNGVPEDTLPVNRTYNYFTYDNQIDHYRQTHYQAHISHQVNEHAILNATFFYIKGKGYFEQFKEDQKFSDYKLDDIIIGNDTITSTDLIRRRWLDNGFFGANVFAKYMPSERLELIIGTGISQYDGRHFGEIIWAQYASNQDIRQRYYDNSGYKTDFNIYSKFNFRINDRLNLFADLQFRNVWYGVRGIDNDQRELDQFEIYNFINPKIGINIQPNDKHRIYFFLGRGGREPTRNDFIDAKFNEVPNPESMDNIEAGYQYTGKKFTGSADFYLMNYTNQLVLTGELNDVGSPIRTNVFDSYRTGMEFQMAWQITKKLLWSANATISANKILNFKERVYVYDEQFDLIETKEIVYNKTTIAYSPSVIAASIFTFTPFKRFDVSFESKYVGKQYLDNTSSESRKLNPYFVSNLGFQYRVLPKFMQAIVFSLRVNNLFNTLYESNGYTYGWFNNNTLETSREYYNFYYPQAGINWLAGISFKF